jgi:hypothetical protein
VRQELSGLTADNAKTVARHLVMAARLLDDDPEQALQHALAARGRAARIGVVREAVGLASYRSGRYADALAELRTARRLTGSNEHLPVLADCERGLGRPERALDLAASPEARTLDVAGRAEILIVAAGARTDLGQPEAAVALLAVPELERRKAAPWLARLRSAYADALEAVGRVEEAQRWQVLAGAADVDGTAGIRELPFHEDVVIDLDEDDASDSDTDADHLPDPDDDHDDIDGTGGLDARDLAPEPPTAGSRA